MKSFAYWGWRVETTCLAIIGMFALGVGGPLTAAPLLVDTFADGNSRNQDLAANSVYVFHGRTGTNLRADEVGAVTFSVLSSSSEAFWFFFTESGDPVDLLEGERLKVSFTFSTGGTPSGNVRLSFGDSKGTRNTTDLTGGQNQANFADDTLYGVEWTVAANGSGSPFNIGRRSETPTGPNNPLNSFADFPLLPADPGGVNQRLPLAGSTEYTVSLSAERLPGGALRVGVAVAGGTLPGNYAMTATDENPQPTFDYISFRIGGSSFAPSVRITRLEVDYVPAPPVILQQPFPEEVTVATGGQLELAVIASGSGLSYQWQRDEEDIDDAASPTLLVTGMTSAQAGTYRCIVSNAGGDTISAEVIVTVSNDPVDPPPVIGTDPVDTAVLLGDPATLEVVATGAGLQYQWSRNGDDLPGETAPTLTIDAVGIADAGAYRCRVRNSGGAVTTEPAVLTVLSPMQALQFSPSAAGGPVPRDTALRITFNQTPVPGTTGHLRVHRAGDGEVVDTINLGASILQKNVGGLVFNYRPVIVTGNSAHIELPGTTKLTPGETYYMTIEAGFFVDSDGAWFGGIDAVDTWAFSIKSTLPDPGAATILVAADGSGDFATVQGAIDFVPANNAVVRLIDIAEGTYPEFVRIPPGKNQLTLRGRSRTGTILAGMNNNNLNPGGTIVRTFIGIDANDITIENLTIRNTTPQGGSQAEAIRTGNNVLRNVFNRLDLYSFQDTVLASGQSFFVDSLIEGDVDFMWGNGSALFLRCELRAVRSGGYYTQIRNSSARAGNVYVDCRLTAPPGITGVFLSRIDPNVFPHSQVVWIDCEMGPHIAPVGWLLNNATSAPNVQFWEYRSRRPDGTLVNTSSRLPASRELSEAEAAFWRDPLNVVGFSPQIAPEIDVAPAPDDLIWGEDLELEAEGTLGVPDAQIQWERDGHVLEGENDWILHLGPAHPSLAGTYTLRLLSPNGIPFASTQIAVIDPYVAFVEANDTLPQDPYLAVGSDLDGDGIPALIEFLLFGSPEAPDRSILPVLGTDATGRLQWTFTRRALTGSAQLLMRESDDLQDWREIISGTNGFEILESPAGPGAVSVHVRLPPGADTRFLQLEAWRSMGL